MNLRKVRWRCRRGTKELDVILNRFVDQLFDELTDSERTLFDQLLDTQDPILQTWFMGESKPINEEMEALVKRILSADPH